MAAATEIQDVAVNEPQSVPTHSDVPRASVEKSENAEDVKKADADVEVTSLDDGPKAYYSKRSVWLMILFSGLAIGSDG